MLPNVAPTIAAQSTLNFGYALLDLAGLAFLGLGVQPPTADWGQMLTDGRESLVLHSYSEVDLGLDRDRGRRRRLQPRRRRPFRARRALAMTRAAARSALGARPSSPDPWAATTPVVNDVSLSLDRGEVVGLVGESGSGKSMTARTILRLLPPGALTRGEVCFDGLNLLAEPDAGAARGTSAARSP